MTSLGLPQTLVSQARRPTTAPCPQTRQCSLLSLPVVMSLSWPQSCTQDAQAFGVWVCLGVMDNAVGYGEGKVLGYR